MHGGCFLVLVAVALLIGGGQGVYMGLVHRECKVLTYDEFVKAPPQHGWFQITGCSLDLVESMYRSGLILGVKEVFIPVHGADSSEKGPIRLLFQTKDPKILDVVEDLRKLGKNPRDGAVLEFAIKNRDRLLLERDVRGMLLYGIEARDKIKDKLARLDDSLDEDFAMIEDGKEPELGFSLVLFLGGVALSGFLVFRVFAPPTKPANTSPDLIILPDEEPKAPGP